MDYLSTIAMTFPGGGYRATAFTFGMLSFLNEVGLIQNLKSISTVSGGTITGAKFAEMQAKNKSFDDFSKELENWLRKDMLLQNSTSHLNNKKKFGHKRQNLINAFALSYNEFINISFGELENGLKENGYLEEVIFNATDFENGMQFRFRTSPGKFGNSTNNYEELKPYVRIGDIIAASTCFPGGFEPISFPFDFVEEKFLNPEENYEPIGLMDGGILDNLGVLSYLTRDKNYDTYIVGDVGKEKIDGFDFAENFRFNRFVSKIFSWWLFALIFILLILSCVFKLPIWIIFGIGILFFLLVIVQIGLEGVLFVTKNKLGLNRSINLPRTKIGLYFVDRINSVLQMNNSIFLRGAKRSNLNLFFAKKEEAVCHCSIYKFTTKSLFQNKLEELGVFVSSELESLSRKCSNMETTLWFTEKRKNEDILTNIIDCGRAVCCYSLMEYMVKRSGGDFIELQDNSIFKVLFEKWATLVKKIDSESFYNL